MAVFSARRHEHVLDVVEFGFAIPVRVIEPIIQQPELVGVGIDIDTSDHANAFDRGFGIAAPLSADQFNRKGVVLIEDRIIKDQTCGVGTTCVRTLSQTGG